MMIIIIIIIMIMIMIMIIDAWSPSTGGPGTETIDDHIR
jgi:hypothetical protein